MLMMNKPDSPVNPEVTTAEFRSPIESVTDVANFVRRHYRVIALTSLAMLGLALLYLVTAAPKFTAQANLLIELKGSQGGGDSASVSTIVESLIGIIKSESISRGVIEKLDLAKDPEFVGKNGVAHRLNAAITQWLGWRKPETESSAMRYALESFERKLSVKRFGLTYIVGITFESADPERAALILNTIAETYVSQQMDAKYSSSLEDSKWVKDRLNELSNQASAAQTALDAYQKNLETYQKNRKETPNSAFSGVASSGVASSGATGAARSVTAPMDVKLGELIAAAESSTLAYDSFRHALRQMDAARHQSLPGFEAHLITEALPPLRASSPKAGIVLGIASVAGLLLGAGLGMVRDLSDRRSGKLGGKDWSGKEWGDKEWKELQHPCLAVIPTVGRDDVLGNLTSFVSGLDISGFGAKWGLSKADSESIPVAPPGSGSQNVPGSRNIVRTPNPIWTITDSPQSRFAESFIELKLAIDSINRRGGRNQVIGVTSTQAHEGKSTVAAALALLMAYGGTRVLLVDCNLRNRSLSTTLAPAGAAGIFDVISGVSTLTDATWTDSTSKLAFLPVGNSARSVSAGDVLASEKLDKLFQALRAAYEYVIIDLPAAAPFVDARAAAHLLDSFLFVVESGRTNFAVVERAIEACGDTDATMLGIALNKAN